VEGVRRWLATWPVPFPSERAALTFFGGDTVRSRAWCGGLERRAGGFWPAFEPGVLIDALAQANERDHWDDWARIRCPALVVRAADGVSAADAQRMADALPGAALVEIADAGHDVHLDQPERWRTAVEEFLGHDGWRARGVCRERNR
jgi:pimeloyl-ACP methyl ester carboxylesterase